MRGGHVLRSVGGIKHKGHYTEPSPVTDDQLLHYWNEYLEGERRRKSIMQSPEILTGQGLKEYKQIRERNTKLYEILTKNGVKP